MSTRRGLTYFLCGYRQNNGTPQETDNQSYSDLFTYEENGNNSEYIPSHYENRGLSCKHAKNYSSMLPRIPNEYDKSKVLYILYNGPEIINTDIIGHDVPRSKSLQKLLSLYEKVYQRWHQQQFKCDNNPFCPKIQKIVFKIYTISEGIRQEIEKYNNNG
ncbi:hypothetical protein cand_016850 [Cryptosporidium andersoni]|uniref:Uncharacterized protein n=1 Tax=Cryptosporidium andersoni TaxID=117008 RepID=A0A1J4MX73_9CRYT|nr:hypothetical protein cand_016850 [Cryptosporidium andersoni]